MSFSRPATFLHGVLIVDAVASGATGLLMLAGAGLLGGLLGLPEPLLRYAGLVLLPYVTFVAFVASRPESARGAVWAIIACNAAWTAASILLLAGGWIAPTLLGYAFVIAQAGAVGALGELQYFALRRSRVTG